MTFLIFELPHILRPLLDLVKPLRVGDFSPMELMQGHYSESVVRVPDDPQVVRKKGPHLEHVVKVVELQID